MDLKEFYCNKCLAKVCNGYTNKDGLIIAADVARGIQCVKQKGSKKLLKCICGISVGHVLITKSFKYQLNPHKVKTLKEKGCKEEDNPEKCKEATLQEESIRDETKNSLNQLGENIKSLERENMQKLRDLCGVIFSLKLEILRLQEIVWALHSDVELNSAFSVNPTHVSIQLSMNNMAHGQDLDTGIETKYGGGESDMRDVTKNSLKELQENMMSLERENMQKLGDLCGVVFSLKLEILRLQEIVWALHPDMELNSVFSVNPTDVSRQLPVNHMVNGEDSDNGIETRYNEDNGLIVMDEEVRMVNRTCISLKHLEEKMKLQEKENMQKLRDLCGVMFSLKLEILRLQEIVWALHPDVELNSAFSVNSTSVSRQLPVTNDDSDSGFESR